MTLLTSNSNNANSKSTKKIRETVKVNRNLYMDQRDFLLLLTNKKAKEQGRWVSESETLRDVIDDYILRTTPEFLKKIKEDVTLKGEEDALLS